MKNFWIKLRNSHEKAGRPILALAPMAGVTDSAFRQICKSFGADVVYSEMASATALSYAPEKTLEMLRFSEAERPYIVQLFGSVPEHFVKAIKTLSGFQSHLVSFLEPDGIDINFGCPVKKVAKQGAGAVLMNNLKLAREIIKSVIGHTDLPVSIKARSKVGQVDILKFLDKVSDLKVEAVMIHGRSLDQGFSGPINTEIIKKARDYFKGIILANGGVKSYEDGMEILIKTKADGLGMARGSLGRPWIFKALRTGQSVERTPKAIFKVALKHAELTIKIKGKSAGLRRQAIIEMRKHLCWYVQGLPGARKMRTELVKVNNINEIRKILK